MGPKVQLERVTLLVPELELRAIRELATGGDTTVGISRAAKELITKQLGFMQVGSGGGGPRGGGMDGL